MQNLIKQFKEEFKAETPIVNIQYILDNTHIHSPKLNNIILKRPVFQKTMLYRMVLSLTMFVVVAGLFLLGRVLSSPKDQEYEAPSQISLQEQTFVVTLSSLIAYFNHHVYLFDDGLSDASYDDAIPLVVDEVDFLYNHLSIINMVYHTQTTPSISLASSTDVDYTHMFSLGYFDSFDNANTFDVYYNMTSFSQRRQLQSKVAFRESTYLVEGYQIGEADALEITFVMYVTQGYEGDFVYVEHTLVGDSRHLVFKTVKEYSVIETSTISFLANDEQSITLTSEKSNGSQVAFVLTNAEQGGVMFSFDYAISIYREERFIESDAQLEPDEVNPPVNFVFLEEQGTISIINQTEELAGNTKIIINNTKTTYEMSKCIPLLD